MTPVVQLGFTLGEYPPEASSATWFDAVAAQALAAEEAGFDSVWVPDHLMQTPSVGQLSDPILECYTALGALATLTSRVRLGAFVGCAAYRNPGLLAKAVTTLDVVSRGRAIFGIGSGWFEAEHDAFGYEFGTAAERTDRLEEVVQIVRSMFTDGSTTFAGRHFQVSGALNYPKPVQRGGPPVLIGGSGEKRTLRMVARYADICNIKGSPDELRHLLAVLDAHCADAGRDPAEICRTGIGMVIVRDTASEVQAALPPAYRGSPGQPGQRTPVGIVAGTPDQVTAQLRELLGAGLDGLILSCPLADRTPEGVARLGAVARAALSSQLVTQWEGKWGRDAALCAYSSRPSASSSPSR